MNEVCRARPSSPSRSKRASLVKICRSGQNRMPGAGPPLRHAPALAGQPGPRGERRLRAVAVEDPGHAAVEADPLGDRRPVDVDVHPRGERVDDREADAVQAAGRDVGAAAELAAGVQLGGDHLDTGQPGLGLLVGGDAATVVVHLDRVVGVQGDLDAVRGAGQRLVDAVVDDLPEAVHQARGCRWSRCTCPDACAPPRGPRAPAGGLRCRCCRRWGRSCWSRCVTTRRIYPRHAVRRCRHACARSDGARSTVVARREQSWGVSVVEIPPC